MTTQKGGWIKLYRSVQNHWLWDNSDYFKWWVDILMTVNHSPNKVLTRDGKLQEVFTGETLTSVNKLAQKWGVTRRTVSKFLSLLEQDEMISVQKTPYKWTTIKVNNYADYQNNSEENVQQVTQQRAQQVTQQRAQQRAHKQEGIRTNKNEKNNIYSSVISYLNEKADTHFKPSSKATQRFIDARVNDKFELDDFKKVIDTKVAGWKGTDWEKFLRPATLFGPKFEDYLNEKNVKPHSTYRNSPGKQEIATDWSKKTVEVDPSITDEYLDSLLDSIDKDTSKEEKDEKIF